MLQKTQEERFNDLISLIASKHSGEMHSLIMFARVTRFYVKIIAENAILKYDAKQETRALFNACNRFIKWSEREAKRKDANVEAWKVQVDERDFEAWGSIFQYFPSLTNEEIEAVEILVKGLASKEVKLVPNENELEIAKN